jgi:SAM-dependent methyltransferase
MKKKRIKNKTSKQDLKNLASQKAIVKVDLGCGENKQADCIGIDFRKVKGVDIVQDLTVYPWKNVPTEFADIAMSSHLLEHINPQSPDPRLAGLLDLLQAKKLITAKEVAEQIGEYRFLGGFVRFMDEAWRILKPGGQFISVFPYAGSPGYWQDPTHINPITHMTLAYFDPLAKDDRGNLYQLYSIYRPKPWKIVKCFYDTNGFIEVCLEKRLIDKSYGTLDDGLNDQTLQ